MDALPKQASRTGKLRVLDPMCGSGTVLAATIARGHEAVGFDMDPLAVLMSQVATSPAPDSLVEQADGVLEEARMDNSEMPEWHDEETARFAEYWFGPKQRAQLARVTRAISEIHDDASRRALQIALSRTIVTKSPRASLAADTSHSRPHKVMEDSDYDVFRGFVESSRSLSRLLAGRELIGSASVHEGDSRDLALVASGTIDLVVTSPPYLNAIDYLRGHRLSLIWLGHTIRELRGIRSDSIGAERSLGSATSESVRETVRLIQDGAADVSRLPVPIITRFAHDMERFAGEMKRVIRAGGSLIAVVGNSTLRGNYIQNDEITRRALELAGLTFEKRAVRDLPDNRRYLPVGAGSGLAARMRKEVVLYFSNPDSSAQPRP